MTVPTTSPGVVDDESYDLASLWNAALRAYQDETSRDLSSGPAVLDLATPDDLLKALEIKGADFKDFRGKHRSLWSRLHSVVGPISKLGTVAQAGASLAPFGPAASAVLGGVVFLLTACNDVSSAYDWIEKVFSELQGFAERLAQYAKSDMDAVMRRRTIAILIFFLRVFGRSEALVRDKRFKKYLKTVFLGEDSKTKSLLEDLNKHTKGELEYVIASVYSTSKATLEATTRIEKSQIDSTDKILSTLKETTASREIEKEQAELKRALGTEATEAVFVLYNTFSENMLKDSATWLEMEDLYRAWQRREIPVLWIMGGPGSGKSYLMTKTIENLNAVHGQAHDTLGGTAVAFFFIKDGRDVQQDPRAILKTWALQISDMDARYAKHALTCCRSPRPLGTARDLWQRLFLDFYTSPKYTDHFAVLLLDGLDEAPLESRREILTLLEGLLQSSRLQSDGAPRIQLAVFSRLDIRSDMSFLMREAYIEVSSKKNEHDMQRYIQERLEQFSVIEVLRRQKPNGHRRASKFATKVMRKVLEGADGVFLWAQLLLQEMENKDQSQIEVILRSPPNTLDSMIAVICQRITDDKDLDQRDVRTMLFSISFAFRDLYFAELHALLCLPLLTTDNMLSCDIILAPKPLLWNNVHSKFASFVRTAYSLDFPPDDDDQEPGKLETESPDDPQTGIATEESEMPLDFGVTEDDEDETEDDEDGVKFDKKGWQELSIEDDPFTDFFEEIADRNAEYLFSLSDAQRNASVSFTHLRIKDYLLLEGHVSTRQHGPRELNFDPDRVHIDMTIDCIRLLRLYQYVGQTPFLYRYSVQNFLKHLEAIDPAHTTELDERRIISGLAWLFCSSDGAAAVLGADALMDDAGKALDESFFVTNRYTQNVKSWLAKASEHRDMFYEDMQDQIKLASCSTVNLLQHFGTNAASEWLQVDSPSCKVTSNTRWYFFILFKIAALDENGIMRDADIGDWQFENDKIIETQSERKIVWLADWPQFRKDATWYTEVAVVLHAAKHDETAAEYFKQALFEDPRLITAREGLATCLHSQEHYTDALEQLAEAIERLDEDSPEISGLILRRAELELGAERMEDCTQSLDEVIGIAIKDPESPDFALCDACAQIFYKAERSDKIIEMLRCLDGLRTDSGLNLLDQYFDTIGDVLQILGRACRLHGKPEFIANAVERTWDRFKETKPPEGAGLSIAAGAMMIFYLDRTEDVIERIEFMVEYSESLQAHQHGLSDVLVATFRAALAIELFDKAVSAHPSQIALDAAAKIKVLSEKLSKDKASRLVPRRFESWAAVPGLLYGRWLRVYEQAAESEWRQYFQARILQQLALLDDDDASNDAAALLPLATTLFHAGDKQNAAVVLGVLYRPMDASKTNAQDLGHEGSLGYKDLRALEEQAEELRLQVEDKARCSCQECEVNNKDADEMYMCEVCVDTWFCGNCMPKLHSGSLSDRVCNTAHEWHRIWPIPEAVKGIAERISEGEVSLHKFWLEELREEWNM